MTTYPPGLCLLLSLSLGLVLGRTLRENHVEVTCPSDQDCTLACTAEPKAGVQYSAVRWYKLRHPSSQQSGLLTRTLPNGPTRWYAGADTNVKLQGDSHDIVLPNVTCSDSGVYICYLAAPVGEQNREGKIVLNLQDCPVEPIDVLINPTENPVDSADYRLTDTWLVIAAAAMLMVAFIIFLISYSCLKNTLREKGKIVQKGKKEILLNAPLKPLEKKDLMLIYTLGPKTSTMKHVCV
uniref:Ig-like domain-containing protein n=1 Tax=Iconisemion striatum TaxID=60296 RepID=A0A1A7YNP0_9TELE